MLIPTVKRNLLQRAILPKPNINTPRYIFANMASWFVFISREKYESYIFSHLLISPFFFSRRRRFFVPLPNRLFVKRVWGFMFQGFSYDKQCVSRGNSCGRASLGNRLNFTRLPLLEKKKRGINFSRRIHQIEMYPNTHIWF